MADIKKIRLSGVTYNIVDDSALHTLDATVTSGGTNAVQGSGVYNAITASTEIVLQTVAESLSGKADNSTVQTLSGKVDTNEEVVSRALNALDADKADLSAITNFFGAVDYDSNSKRINFYHESTTGSVLAYIDATDFVKDGFLSSVTIDNRTISGESVPCLVFVWNTDSGVQETDIPLSGIFDPSNYYTTAQTQAYVTGYTYDKATIDQKVQDSGTFDPTQYYTTAQTYSKSEVDTALNGKQATLVSGTNIKTVGTNSLLGSGNIALMTASIGTGNDSETLIFDFA